MFLPAIPVIALASVLLTFSTAKAQDNQSQESGNATAVEASAEALAQQSEALGREIEALREEFATVSQRLKDTEEILLRAKERLQDLEVRRALATEAFAKKREAFHRTLAALQRIALRPRAALLASAEPPIDTLRGALLLGSALPRIEICRSTA